MKLVSIDTETSSLDPKNGQILQFGAVVFDTESEFFSCHAYSKIISNKKISGEVGALIMNSWLIEKINKFHSNPNEVDETQFIEIENLAQDFSEWLSTTCNINGTFIVTGKNFFNFDDKFLGLVPAWRYLVHYRNRSLDVGTLYAQSSDVVPPSLDLCKERALNKYPEHAAKLFPNSSVSHDALDDAKDVAKLIWMHYNLPK